MTLRVELEHRFRVTTLAMKFEAPTPGVIALFGPSGSGKTSLLNAIAGLLRAALSVPIVYASHALDEVMRLADTLVLIEAGRVRAAGPLAEIATRVDLPLAARDDASGVLFGAVAGHVEQRRLTAIACGDTYVWVPMLQVELGTRVRLRVPAREVILALDAPSAISVNNILPALVLDMAEDDAAHAALVSLEVAGGQLLARVTLDAADRLNLMPGKRLMALVKAMSVELRQD
jgi:molybdate transport system ATP-binding protein